jgi:hypothetical protein
MNPTSRVHIPIMTEDREVERTETSTLGLTPVPFYQLYSRYCAQVVPQAFRMDQGPSLICMSRCRRKKTIKGPIGGKRMLRESLYSCVVILVVSMLLCNAQPENCRLAYSLSRQQYWSPCLSRISGQIHRIPRRSISKTSISFSQTPTSLIRLSLPPQLNHPLSLRRNMQSGSTHFGS